MIISSFLNRLLMFLLNYHYFAILFSFYSTIILFFMKRQNKQVALKQKNFQFYYAKYHRTLNEPSSLIDPLNLLCGGWFLQTFKQIISKLSTNKSSPLPLFFPNLDSLEPVTKNKNLREKIFQSFDTRSIKRIDGCELYCSLMLVAKGSYQVYLKTIVDVFGFQFTGRIQRDQFIFFLDNLFRAIPKIVIIKGFPKPTEPNIRLQYEEIVKFTQSIFGDKEEIERNEIYQAMLKQPNLNQFIRYIQKRCNGSAEKSRSEIAERAVIQLEVRAWLWSQIDKIERQLDKDRQHLFAKILE